MVTTRLSNLASQLTGSVGLSMNFLDENRSWDLFCKIVFGEEECPPNLKEIGNIIVQNCKGLPLSIVVIGGVLAKSEMKLEYWKRIAENLNSIVNLEDNERCLQILYTSYSKLPVHLKPCFLSMGVVPENYHIRAKSLILLWISEGLLKHIGGKSLEDVGKKYLKELVDRNLILVHEYTFRGRIKKCRIHDLLRDLCLREAQKHKFLCVNNINPKYINTARRISIVNSKSKWKDSVHQILDALETPSLARSYVAWEYQEPSPSSNFRLLRVFLEQDNRVPALPPSSELVNLRHIVVKTTWESLPAFVHSFPFFWNLQSVKVSINYRDIREVILAPSEIWEMPLLRCVHIPQLELPDPPTSSGYRSDGREDNIVLTNLHTLDGVVKFKYSGEVVKRIPNIKKLKVSYGECDYLGSPPDDLFLDNLCNLHKLETLRFWTDIPLVDLWKNITFPPFLKKLILIGTRLKWEDMAIKIGSLPLLEVLILAINACVGPHLETVEGQFCSLKSLLIRNCPDLEDWMTEDSTHFPRLERLILKDLDKLEEIPSCMGDIPTLKLIKLQRCSDSAINSAQRILEEQQEYENVDLKVEVLAEE